MLKPIFEKLLSNVVAENRIYKFCTICLTVSLIWQQFEIRDAMHHQRTILVPSNIDRRVTITDGYASPEYVITFAREIVNLAFTYNNASARFQFGELLQQYATGSFVSAKKSFYEMADTIERSRTSSMFIISQPIVADVVKNQLTVIGTQRQWVDVNPLPPEQKTYLIDYCMTDGKFQVVSISERKDTRPANNAGKPVGTLQVDVTAPVIPQQGGTH